MDTFRPSGATRQAYIHKMLKAQQPRGGVVFGAGRVLQEGRGIGADIIRHVFLLAGVFGLVAIAVGALTDNPIYLTTLNSISNWFVR